jgi:3-mercaptopropionate dioxygenase
MRYHGEAEASVAGGSALPPLTMAGFCTELGHLLDGVPDEAAPELAASVLPRLLTSPDLLAPVHRTVPKGPYGRHTMFLCPRDRFSVLAMVWPAGVVSPVHDHLTWCAFGVYEGTLEESRFLPAPGGTAERPHARRTATLIHRSGDVGSLPMDAPDIHSMANPTDRATISIHVYGGNAEKQGPNLKRSYVV